MYTATLLINENNFSRCGAQYETGDMDEYYVQLSYLGAENSKKLFGADPRSGQALCETQCIRLNRQRTLPPTFEQYQALDPAIHWPMLRSRVHLSTDTNDASDATSHPYDYRELHGTDVQIYPRHGQTAKERASRS